MEIVCPMGCGIKLRMVDLMEHPRVCNYRRVMCKYCQENIVFAHRTEHKDICTQYPLACPNSCGLEGIARRNLTAHLLQCVKAQMACKHARLGCQYLGFGMELEEHERDVLCHFSILADQFLKLHQSNDETKAALREVEKENKTLTQGLQSVNDRLKKMQEQLKGIDKANKNVDLSNDVKCVIKRLDALEMFTRNAESMKDFHEVSQSPLNAASPDIMQKINDHALRLKQLSTRDGGVFLWKITDFSKLREKAKSGVMAFVTPYQYFLTNYHGYKLGLKLFPEGDGPGQKTHLSLYAVIVKGPYDDTLPWPFAHNITFILLNQANGKNHYQVILHPDPNLACFQKPKKAPNMGAGSPTFISHAELYKDNLYIRNDVMFLKVVVS